MDGTTTFVDVIEEHLGYDLVPRNLPRLEPITDLELKALGRALYDASRSGWMRLPAFDDDAGCFTPHPESSLTSDLGGIGWGAGLEIPATAPQMTGKALLTLTYLPRIAIKDGIQYFLDYYDYAWLPTPERRRTILNILTFYARCRELIRTGHIVVIPRDLWEDPRTIVDGDTDPGLIGATGARLRADGFERMGRNLARSIERDEGEYLELLRKEPPEGVDKVVHNIALKGTLETRQLLRFAEYSGYGPLLDAPHRQYAFDSMAQAARVDGRGTLEIERGSVVVPLLAGVSVDDFSAALQSGAFDHFRRCITQIGSEAGDLLPVDRRDLIRDRLQAGKQALDREIDRSAVLRLGVSGAWAVTIGTLMGAPVAATIDRQLAESPWKLLLAGGAAVGAALTEAAARTRLRQRQLQGVSRLFASLSSANR